MGRARSTDAQDPTSPVGADPARGGTARSLRLIAIAVVAVAAMALIVSGWDSPIRVWVTLAFFLFVPGLALAELLVIHDPVQRLAVATSASLAVETLVALTFVYAGWFSAEVASAVVVALTLAALAAAARTRQWRVPFKVSDRAPRRAAP